MKNRKRKGWIENFIGMLFILVLFLFMFINLAVPDREMSETYGIQPMQASN